MEKITKEEFGFESRGFNNTVVQEILKLEVNEGLKITFGEWSISGLPHSILANVRIRTGKKFSVKTMKESGYWLILRIK